MRTRSEELRTLEAELRSHVALREPEPGRRLGTHPSKYSLQGYRTELGVMAKAARARQVPGGKTLVVVTRPRSGSTLLMNLLGQVPGISAQMEVLVSGKAMPLRFLRNLRRLARTPVLGYKIMSYQLMIVQGVRRPVAFLNELSESGARFVHLRRSTREVTISLLRASAMGQGHLFGEQATSRRSVRLDPEEATARARWNAAYLDFEDRLMSGVPHLRLDYAEALADAEAHQATIDRVCAHLGHPTGPVSARLRKVGDEVSVANRDEVDAALSAAGF